MIHGLNGMCLHCNSLMHCIELWKYCFKITFRLWLIREGLCEITSCLGDRSQLATVLDHNNDVIMSAMASQIISLTIVYSTVYSGADQRKHQSSASLAFVRGIHRWPVNFPHKGPVTRKIFPFDDVIMISLACCDVTERSCFHNW